MFFHDRFEQKHFKKNIIEKFLFDLMILVYWVPDLIIEIVNFLKDTLSLSKNLFYKMILMAWWI